MSNKLLRRYVSELVSGDNIRRMDTVEQMKSIVRNGVDKQPQVTRVLHASEGPMSEYDEEARLRLILSFIL